MKQARNGAGIHPDTSRSMQERFQKVNEVIRNSLRRGNPRVARFGHRFEVLHNFASKSMQEAVGGQYETVLRQEGHI